MKVRNLAGTTIGKLFVHSLIGSVNGKKRWHCVCQCGATSSVATGNLMSGNTRSCGCDQIEAITVTKTVHGLGRKFRAEYRSWMHMRDRCRNPNNKDFDRYGGRGISICERWNEFAKFIEDMGARPTNLHSLDRYPNNDGNYEPTNCRWATKVEQANNRNPKQQSNERTNHDTRF